ncbi:hypothetical protein [Trueperella pyogenes]|uniref:hypothetical protein n=1 Tax=Trueperella pyogenes TaxID=1661 RepID=UPI0012D300C9|nr:hypothetical protein [Trueperella pyogenes]
MYHLRSLGIISVASTIVFAGALPAQASQETSTSIDSPSYSAEDYAPILRLTPQEEEKLIEETARGLEVLYTEAATLDQAGNITHVDMRILHEKLQEMGLGPIITPRSWESFGTCLAKKIGISDAKEIARIVFNDQVKILLKSYAWKKASAIIVQRIKRVAGQKGASWAVKKLAHKLLPGGLVGEIAVGAVWCGAKEGWDWWNS